jgi:flavin-dependent dehydrogenase
MRNVDVVIVGASLAAAAAAKRTVDAGLETVILERKELPRHKICSGILSPRGHRFLLENFGPLPREVLHEPTSCRGVTFHFPCRVEMPMDFFHGTTPHLHRKYSDHWAIQRSGAEVHDQTSFAGLEDRGDHVIVHARRGGEPIEYRARQVIGADGPSSLVVRAVYPDYTKQIPWFFVGQKFHEIIDCPLSPEYFHFWFHPGLGHYTWSHARDGRQIVGVGFKRGDNFAKKHQVVEQYLRDKHGVQLKPADDDHEGCAENFGPSLINRYVFGKGNVLVTGQAAGFLNMIGEGMSCALHSGAISGEAIVEASTPRPAGAGDLPQDDRLRSAPLQRPVEPAQDRLRPPARGGFSRGADEAVLARAQAGVARHVELRRAVQGIQVGPADRRGGAAAAAVRRLPDPEVVIGNLRDARRTPAADAEGLAAAQAEAAAASCRPART